MCLDFKASNLLKLGLDVGGAVMSHVQGNERADLAESSARSSERFQLSAINAQQAQANASITDQQGLRARQATIERARLRAASAESGLAGFSSNRVVGEASATAGMDIAAMEANRTNVNEQYGREREGVKANTKSRLNEIAGTRPSLLGTGLQLGAAGAGYFSRAAEFDLLQKRTVGKIK